MTRLIPAFMPFLESDGDVLAGGKLYFYEKGTTTPKDTFSDPELLTANTNPIILNSAGKVSVDVWGTGDYKLVVKDSADVLFQTFDPLLGFVGNGFYDVRYFGVVGDGSTDNASALQTAFEYLESVGGGTLYFPEGDYRTSKPLIVRSKIQVRGDGPGTVITSTTSNSPNGTVILVGVFAEWEDWAGTSGTVTDANVTQFDSGDYSKITTSGVIIENLTVKSTAATPGPGIFVVNSENVVIRNIWGDNVATPVSVGNDNSSAYGGCRNVTVDGVFEVTGGRWYDLVFVGESEYVTVTNAKNNPESKSTLSEAIVVSGRARWADIHGNTIRFDTVDSSVGISLNGASSVPTDANYVHDNIIEGAFQGIVVFQYDNQEVHRNHIENCTRAIQVYNTGNSFDGNTFAGNTYDFYFNSANSSVISGSELDRSRITGNISGVIDNQKFRNNIGYGGIRCHVMRPVDAVVEATDVSNVSAQTAVLTKSSGTVDLWFRLPSDLEYILETTAYWYAAAASETLKVGLYYREGHSSVNTFLQVGSTQNYSSAASGDQTDTWSSINTAVTNPDARTPDQYYLKVTCDWSNASSQFRSIQIKYHSAGGRS